LHAAPAAVAGSAAFGLIRDIDARASLWLYRRNRGVVGGAAVMMSAIGAEAVFIPCAAVAASVAVLKQQFAGALALALVTVITSCCLSVFKRIVPRNRPAGSGLTSSSFPSGHTMASFAVYGIIAVVFTRSYPGWLPLIVVASSLLATAVGIARVIRGFHWLTDVVAGVVSGLALFTLACLGLWYL
jgi:membrane-associated phospholipid phosphatase